MNPLRYALLLLVLLGLQLPVPARAGEHDHLNQQMVLATLWQQQSAEARALSYQAWHLARRILEEDLATGPEGARAVVVDVDETVLDNTPFQVRCIEDGTAYPTGWLEWCREAQARPLPGALEFLRWADRQGVAVYYVSNRKAVVLQESIRNLREAGFPQADEEHCLFRTDTSSKEPRREKIRETHRIVLLAGDNLGDFAEVFEGTTAERNGAVDEFCEEFGSRFIVLPNPMYGAWEGALGEGYFGLGDEQKMQARQKALRRD